MLMTATAICMKQKVPKTFNLIFFNSAETNSTEMYYRYTPDELRYLPINTTLYSPHKSLSRLSRGVQKNSQTDEEESDVEDGVSLLPSTLTNSHLLPVIMLCCLYNLLSRYMVCEHYLTISQTLIAHSIILLSVYMLHCYFKYNV